MDPSRVLPHGPPARLLTRVIETSGDRARAIGRIGPEAPGAGPAGAPAILGLELGAQCAAMIARAAPAGSRQVDDAPADPPRIGYLVSIRSARFDVAFLPVESDLEVEARRVGGVGGLEVFEITVQTPGRAAPVVLGTLGTMLTERRVAVAGTSGSAAE
ncbi:MAG TPA: hypothetical protein VMV46_14080 [Thermoanaerobaculia bacterium]|nr:hypothetical protein [Thermoanaerobaculia bacterium]